MAPADRPIAPALLEVFDCSPSDGSYYLDELLERLEMQSPGHPLVAVFQPLMQADLTILEHEAGRYYNEIAQGVIDDRQRLRLQEVFMDWLLQRFSDRGAKEIEKMLVGQLPDLRDTQTGKELIAIGKIEGREEGREEGKEYGLRHGELIGQIRILQEVLGMETTDRRVLAESSLELLSSQLAELRAMFNQH